MTTTLAGGYTDDFADVRNEVGARPRRQDVAGRSRSCGASRALGPVDAPVTPEAFFAAGLSATDTVADLVGRAVATGNDVLFHNEADLKIGPCVPAPGKIICVGLNYRRHAEESGLPVPETPILFSKYNNAIAAPDEPVPLPKVGVEYDYEAELAFVIGKPGAECERGRSAQLRARLLERQRPERPRPADADEPVAARQVAGPLPAGWAVPRYRRRGADPKPLRIRCWLDGELRQDSNTADMVFTWPRSSATRAAS